MDSKSNAAMRTDDTLPDTPTALPESKTVPETPSVSLSETASKTEKPGAVPLRVWMRGTGARYLVRIMALVVAVVLWELASDNGFHFYVSFDNIPAPSIVGSALVAELTGQEFYLHILHSLERVAIAYVLAVVLGVLLGVAMGRSRWAEDIILPYIELLRPIPAVAWIPLAILMLPTEQSSIIFITFLGALFPVILNTVHGVEQTNSVLIRAARSLGASRTAILWQYHMPENGGADSSRTKPRRKPHRHSLACGTARRHAVYCRRIGDRHGCGLVLSSGWRDHQWTIRHRLLHLELLHPYSIPANYHRHAHHWRSRHPVYLAGSQRL